WGLPVSDHPQWKWQGGARGGLAGVRFGAPGAGGGARAPPLGGRVGGGAGGGGLRPPSGVGPLRVFPSSAAPRALLGPLFLGGGRFGGGGSQLGHRSWLPPLSYRGHRPHALHGSSAAALNASKAGLRSRSGFSSS